MTCIEEGCDRPSKKRGLCDTCYQRHRKAGTLPPAPCLVEGCPNEAYRRGPCRPHREEFRSAGTKWCTGPECESRIRPIGEFVSMASDSGSFDGLSSWCKSCRNRYSANSHADNRETRVMKQAEYRAGRRAINPGWHHGITDDHYWRLWTDQRGRCAICSKDLDYNGTEAVVPHGDHDHAHCSGPKGCPECFRALLCKGCNSMLGRAHDDLAILRRWRPTKAYPQKRIDAATAYLEYWHAEMALRGIRPSLEDAFWQDLFASATRLLLEIAPN